MSEPVPIRQHQPKFRSPFKSWHSVPRMRFWLTDLKLVELKCLHVIWEYTTARHRYRDAISMGQFVEITGHGRAQISKAIAALEKHGLIAVERTKKKLSIYEPLNPPFRG